MAQNCWPVLAQFNWPLTSIIRLQHMLSGWATSNRLVLGQKVTEEKSKEITSISALLKLLELKVCIITIDAMGCQREISKQIIHQKGDYVLGFKGNQALPLT